MEGEALQAVLAAPAPIVLTLAVLHIADERAREVLQVPPNLVEPPGVWARLDERVASDGFAQPDLRDGVDALGAGFARNGVVDEHVGRRVAAGDREVAFVYTKRVAPRQRKPSRGFRVERKQDDAGRAAVEAVHGEDVLPDQVTDGLEQWLVVVRPAAVDHRAGRLVDGHEPVVAEEDTGRGTHGGDAEAEPNGRGYGGSLGVRPTSGTCLTRQGPGGKPPALPRE